jgi:hypothetical protein
MFVLLKDLSLALIALVFLSGVGTERGCYHQEAGSYEEAIFGEAETLQHSAVTLRPAHQDGVAREGD